METYELEPTDGHKSFYNKAIVTVHDDGTEILRSYETNVIAKTPDGAYHRLWNGWSATTGRHIKAFSGLNKAEYNTYPYEGNCDIWKEYEECTQ